MFGIYSGDLMNLPTDENHLVYRWVRDDCKILFSVTKKGDAASCHFASDKRGLRFLSQASDEFCEFCFKHYWWCNNILANVGRPSITKMLKRIKFEQLHMCESPYQCVLIRRK